MIATNAFRKICSLKHKNKVIQGSQGAGKTYSILLRWILLACKSEKQQFCSIVTATFPALESGAIKDFKLICDGLGVPYRETRKPCVFRINKWTFQFFSVDKENKGLGSRRDRLFINEANRISWAIAKQLIKRTHVECIFDFNPVVEFWAHTQFVNVDDCAFIKLTYKDNEALPQAEIDAIEKFAPWGKTPDENEWRVFGLGEVGFTKGTIFTYQTYSQLPEGEYQEAIGVDFGWEDPLVFVKVYCDHKNRRLFWKLLFYGSQAKYEDVLPMVKALPEYNSDIFFCDHEPRDIFQFRKYGLKAMNADKSNGIEADIRSLKQWEIHVHEDSALLISELNNYKYQVKTMPTGEDVIIPYPAQNQQDHAIDAGKYGSTFIISRK